MPVTPDDISLFAGSAERKKVSTGGAAFMTAALLHIVYPASS